jgi:putative lipoic acid-binding regulatory protein
MSEEQTLLEFPCQFSIKAMGKNHPEFNLIVVGIVKEHIDNAGEIAVKSRPSKGEKYIALTVTIEVISKKQLDAIYQGLTDCPEVLFAL